MNKTKCNWTKAEDQGSVSMKSVLDKIGLMVDMPPHGQNASFDSQLDVLKAEDTRNTWKVQEFLILWQDLQFSPIFDMILWNH